MSPADVVRDAAALSLAVLAYGVSSLLLGHGSAAPGNPLRNRTWWSGTAAQAVGFLAAFVARGSLPLVVVQPAVAVSVGVTYALGVRLGRWRVTRAELAGLAGSVAGLAALAWIARPGEAGLARSSVLFGWALLAAAMPACLLLPRRGRVTMLVVSGAAGIAYAVAAAAGRTLAADPVTRATVQPLAVVVLLGATVVGQVLLTRALSGGAVTAPIAVVYAVSTVAASAAGRVWLGDAWRSDAMGWVLTVAATAAVLVGVAVLSGATEGRPQHSGSGMPRLPPDPGDQL